MEREAAVKEEKKKEKSDPLFPPSFFLWAIMIFPRAEEKKSRGFTFDFPKLHKRKKEAKATFCCRVFRLQLIEVFFAISPLFRFFKGNPSVVLCKEERKTFKENK